MTPYPQQKPILPDLTDEGREAARAAIEILKTMIGPHRTLDRTLAVFFGDETFMDAPCVTGSVDAVLCRIHTIFPRWTHGYSWCPQAKCDMLVECRAWIGGPGHITDDYMGDYFEGEAATPAIALLIALLEAIIHDGLKEVK